MTTYIDFGMAALRETVAAVLHIMTGPESTEAPVDATSASPARNILKATVVKEPAKCSTSFTITVFASDYSIMPYKVSATTTLAELRALIQDVKRIAPCQMRLAYKGKPLGGVPGDAGYGEMESVPLSVHGIGQGAQLHLHLQLWW